MCECGGVNRLRRRNLEGLLVLRPIVKEVKYEGLIIEYFKRGYYGIEVRTLSLHGTMGYCLGTILVFQETVKAVNIRVVRKTVGLRRGAGDAGEESGVRKSGRTRKPRRVEGFCYY